MTKSTTAQTLTTVEDVRPFTGADVRRYAQHIAGHPDAEITIQHMQAVRAVLDGLSLDGRLLPEPVTQRTEWATEVVRLDATRRHTPAADDAEFAAFTTEAINTHLGTLNEATRREYGVERATTVQRTAREYADGATHIGPWQPFGGPTAIEHRVMVEPTTGGPLGPEIETMRWTCSCGARSEFDYLVPPIADRSAREHAGPAGAVTRGA